MRAALGTQSESFLYSLENETFSWKRLLSSGLVAKLGQIKLEKVPVLDTFESVLEKLLNELHSVQKTVVQLRSENCSLRTDRDSALSKVTEFASVKTEWEKKLYGQFMAVLNAKKERIMALEEMLDLQIADQDGKGRPSSGAGNAEAEEMQTDEEDPYGGDTDVDSDDVGDVADPAPAASTSASASTSSALRRRRDIFDSFDSPGSPASPSPMLPKRARAKARVPAASATTSSASASTRPTKNVFRNVFEDDDDGGDGGDDGEVGLQEAAASTQDLIDEL